MLGAGLQFGRSHGEDRFYNPAKARRNNQNKQRQDPLRRAQSDVTVVSHRKRNSVKREQESQGGWLVETPKPVPASALVPVVSHLCNLERFLESVTLSIPAQYLPKDIGLPHRQVAIRFQNRRARLKTNHLEKDYKELQARYNHLKADYDSILMEKEKLKAEVLQILENLLSGQKEKGNLEYISTTTRQSRMLTVLISVGNGHFAPYCNVVFDGVLASY